MKARRTVHAIGVEQRHRGHAEMGTDSGEFLGQGCALEKAESGTGVKFDIHLSSVASTRTQKNLSRGFTDKNNSFLFPLFLKFSYFLIRLIRENPWLSR
jgi:hypothetical protein